MIGRAVRMAARRRRNAGGTPLDPSTLSNLTYLFRANTATLNNRVFSNTAGTTPVTTNGSVVNSIRDEVTNYLAWDVNNSGTMSLVVSGSEYAIAANTQGLYTSGFPLASTGYHLWCWFNSANASGHSNQVAGGYNFGEAGIGIDNSGKVVCTNNGSLGSQFIVANTWHLAQLWCDGSDTYLQLDNNTPDSVNALQTTTGTLLIMDYQFNSGSTGYKVSQVGVRDVTPTAGEISGLYSAGPQS